MDLFYFFLDPQYLKRKMAKLGNSANTDKIGRFIAENMGGAGGKCDPVGALLVLVFYSFAGTGCL